MLGVKFLSWLKVNVTRIVTFITTGPPGQLILFSYQKLSSVDSFYFYNNFFIVSCFLVYISIVFWPTSSSSFKFLIIDICFCCATSIRPYLYNRCLLFLRNNTPVFILHVLIGYLPLITRGTCDRTKPIIFLSMIGLGKGLWLESKRCWKGGTTFPMGEPVWG